MWKVVRHATSLAASLHDKNTISARHAARLRDFSSTSIRVCTCSVRHVLDIAASCGELWRSYKRGCSFVFHDKYSGSLQPLHISTRHACKEKNKVFGKVAVEPPPSPTPQLEDQSEPEQEEPELEQVAKYGSGGDTGSQDVRGKGKRKYNNFTDRQEELLVEWLLDNPIMYNKCLKEYKNKEKKAAMWSELNWRLIQNCWITRIYTQSPYVLLVHFS